jgi:4'-phosphopantetheinyl transferase
MKGLKKFGFQKNVLEEIQYTKYNRPFLPGNIDFNISHSGHCVVCAISRDYSLGIDVEEVKPVLIRDFNSQFNDGELHRIYNAEDKLVEFYNLWTKKEAIIKADGRGMSIPLKSIVFNNSHEAILTEQKWYIKQIDLNNTYCAHLAVAGSMDKGIQVERCFF